MDDRELLGEDTIVAPATPPGEGGIGIIRLSGKDSFAIAKKISRLKNRKKFLDTSSHVMLLGAILDPEKDSVVDEVFVVPMRAPHTYTGQDVVELHAHGSPAALRKITALCIQYGARPAQPGEFTKRAFLSGRMDLSQAEAVLDMIQAKNEKALSIASAALTGKLKEKILAAHEKLIFLLARVEVIFDYPEEGLEEISLQTFIQELEKVYLDIGGLCETYEEGKKIKDGFKAVLAGKPNAGKSSLLNALVQRDRAIVADIPGTTRDTLEADVHLQGIPVVFVDTAGLRKKTGDAVERMGMARAKEALEDADIVLAVFDLSSPFNKDDESVLHETSGKPRIIVLNKNDLERKLDAEKIKRLPQNAFVVETSATRGDGLEMLKEKMLSLIERAAEHSSHEETVLTNLRHKNALEQARACLGETLKNAKKEVPMDVLTVELRAAASALDAVTGVNASSELLSEIFSRFCVGK